MLTIFTIPKTFRGHIDVIQRNAIQSWMQMHPRPEILLFGDDKGTDVVAREFDLKHIPSVAQNEFGTPLINGMFEKVRRSASNNIICYVNADIILMSDFMKALETLSNKKSFLMIGQRWDVEVDFKLDTRRSDWEEELQDHVRKNGKLQGHRAIDYFAYNRELFEDIPPFAIGRPHWDNWLVYHARFLGAPVIDATEVVTAVHQNHDYAHLSISGNDFQQMQEAFLDVPEARRNLELAGGYDHLFGVFQASQKLTARGLVYPIPTRETLALRVKAFAVLHPYLGFWFKLVRSIRDSLRSLLSSRVC